jgi:hypothetical protein
MERGSRGLPPLGIFVYTAEKSAVMTPDGNSSRLYSKSSFDQSFAVSISSNEPT